MSLTNSPIIDITRIYNHIFHLSSKQFLSKQIVASFICSENVSPSPHVITALAVILPFLSTVATFLFENAKQTVLHVR